MSFTYNGVSSDAKKLNITERTVYTAPDYDVNAIEVPGRSGDLLNPQNRYKNKTITYIGFIRSSDFAGNTQWERMSAAARELKAWLCVGAGEYHDLTDDYDPGYTRQAYISGETSIELIHDRPNGATVTVTFNAKPFMYGPAVADVTLNTAGSITNPNAFPSLPKLAITMSAAGTLTVGDATWEIAAFNGTMTCDSELMDWYSVQRLRNNLVTGSGWPTLMPGANSISWTGGISKVKITPRWRTL